MKKLFFHLCLLLPFYAVGMRGPGTITREFLQELAGQRGGGSFKEFVSDVDTKLTFARAVPAAILEEAGAKQEQVDFIRPFFQKTLRDKKEAAMRPDQLGSDDTAAYIEAVLDGLGETPPRKERDLRIRIRELAMNEDHRRLGLSGAANVRDLDRELRNRDRSGALYSTIIARGMFTEFVLVHRILGQ